MEFFTEDQATNYYDKPFQQISPTDQPQDRYMVGQDTFQCPECDEQLETECNEAYLQRAQGRGTGGSGFIERAYCTNCHIEYKRSRTPVIDKIDYQYKQNRTDEREEYVCRDCKQPHPLTEPKNDFTYITDPTVKSLESASINCPCGARHNINNLQLDTEINCDNCTRRFKLTVVGNKMVLFS